MIELLLCPVLSFLVLGSMLVVIFYVDNAENIERKESEKLVNEYLGRT